MTRNPTAPGAFRRLAETIRLALCKQNELEFAAPLESAPPGLLSRALFGRGCPATGAGMTGTADSKEFDMAALYAKLATTLLALALTATGVTLAASVGGSPLPTPIAPFGCGA